MNDLVYLNEWTWASTLGHLLLALALGSGLVATLAYGLATVREPNVDGNFEGQPGRGDWHWLGRWGFRVHSVSVALAFALLYILIFSHRYEFSYIWKHLNDAMPSGFVLSSFWGGQEGGFFLWMGFILILAAVFLRRRPGRWEAPVIAIIAGVTTVLTSMLLGLWVGETQIGIDPFLLLRQSPENIGLPWTFNPEYLTLIPQFADGQGLNPLLQNYWMVIHPPVLFLGFASTIMPFAFACAGLWRGELKAWMKPATQWSFFGVGVLGAGILMGGAWAYEALSFGGFWAWDPVENSSLVPWMVLVAAAHLLMINRAKSGTAVTATTLLSGASFLLVMYSTFLTKSGILGDTSVHSFVDSGILSQLLAFTLLGHAVFGGLLLKPGRDRWVYLAVWGLAAGLTFTGWAVEGIMLGLLALTLAALRSHFTRMPAAGKESPMWSREFWMFVAAMLVMAAAAHITFQTSLPVFNHFLTPFEGVFESLHNSTGWGFWRKLATHDLAPGSDFERTFHAIQVPLAFLFIGISAFAQFLRYRSDSIKQAVPAMVRSTVAASVLTVMIISAYGFELWEAPRIALIFSALWSMAANLDYAVSWLKGRWDAAGASIAHFGFAMLILGAVLSNAKKSIISQNTLGDLNQLNETLHNNEDLLLLEGDTVQMGPYFVNYRAKRQDDVRIYFQIDYFDAQAASYAAGQLTTHDGLVFEALTAHRASPHFADDVGPYWRFLPRPNARQKSATTPWRAGAPGEFAFTLEPRIQLNEKMGNSPEPDTRHGLFKDLYTHIRWGRVSEPVTDAQGWLEGRQHAIHRGDSMLVGRSILTLDSISAVRTNEKHALGLLDKDLAVAAHFSLHGDVNDTVITPLYILRDSLIIPDHASALQHGVRVRIDSFDPRDVVFHSTVWEHSEVRRDFIVMQAIIFPQINLLWLGCLIMTVGVFMSMRYHRRRKTPASRGEKTTTRS